MADVRVDKSVRELAVKAAKPLGCYIYHVEFVKEGGLWFLRVFADKDGGITLDDCEAISRSLDELLDKADVIKRQYYLEVSSPGIDRKLYSPEHFEMYAGEMVEVGLYKPVNGEKRVVGALAGLEDGVVSLNGGGAPFSVPLSETSYVRLYIQW